MSARWQRVGVWSGLAMIPVFFVGLGVIARFIPPTAPGDSAAEIARMYQEHHGRIQAGVFIAAMGAPLLLPYFVTLGVQMKRIEGRTTPLAYTQMIAGGLLILVFVIPMFTWQAAAFRPERPAATTQALNDLAWLPFVGIVMTVLLQWAATAAAIFSDRRSDPVFPRWLGYLTLWTCVGIIPGGFIVFFKDGPLAWNGILGWWVLIMTFFVWMVCMARALLRAIDQQEREEALGRAIDLSLAERVDALTAEVEALRQATGGRR